MQARQRFGAQVIEPLARALGDVAEGLQRAAASQQQIALDQVRQAEIGFNPEQRFNVIERLIEAVVLDFLECFAQQFVGALVRLGGAGERKKALARPRAPAISVLENPRRNCIN